MKFNSLLNQGFTENDLTAFRKLAEPANSGDSSSVKNEARRLGSNTQTEAVLPAPDKSAEYFAAIATLTAGLSALELLIRSQFTRDVVGIDKRTEKAGKSEAHCKFNLPFPALFDRHFVEVNLDHEARIRQDRTPKLSSTRCGNPFLDSDLCYQFTLELARLRGADFSYGGYLEDRRFLWNQSYLDGAKTYLHLGVDFNVPAGTKVAALFEGEVVRVDDDHPIECGWGPRIIIRPDNGGPYCIFSHLSKIAVHPGMRVSKGQRIAEVGDARYNGNWFAHLHIQTVERGTYERLLAKNLIDLDGYGDERIIDDLKRMFPDPLRFPWLVGAAFATPVPEARK